MKEPTQWKLIGLALLLCVGVFTSKKILEHRINAVRPLANQQAMENVELVNEYGDKKASQYFQSNHIYALRERVDQYNAARPYMRASGLVAATLAVAGAWPNRKR